MSESIEHLLEFFKALADTNRLKIIGLLAQDEYSVEQLAELLEVKPSTVSHHLGKLSSVGLVQARAESYYNMYSLKTGVLESLSEQLFSRELVPAVTADVDMDAYDRKVIETFCDAEGRITRIPAQRKKVEVLLRHIMKAFEPDIRYTDKQVNEKLSFYNDDIATLRRSLIANKLMDRKPDGSEYWVITRAENDTTNKLTGRKLDSSEYWVIARNENDPVTRDQESVPGLKRDNFYRLREISDDGSQ